MPRFGAVLTAMVTPFDVEGRLDLDVAQELAVHLVGHGSDGLVLTGTTGEVSTLEDVEKIALWKAVRDAVTVPVIAGSGSNDTPHSVDLTAQVAATGVDAILAVTPYYNRPSQAGIEAHFRAMAAVTDLPVMVYDIPVRAGRKISRDVLVRLATEVDNVVALKDASGNPAATAQLIADLPEGFEVYSGDDSMTLPLLAVGAVGVVSVASHWSGERMAAMVEAHRAGNVTKAAELNRMLLSSYDFEASDDAPNPLPAKAMMRALGFAVGQCRLPMGDASDDLDTQALALAASFSPS